MTTKTDSQPSDPSEAQQVAGGDCVSRLVRHSKMWSVYVKYDDSTDWRSHSLEPDEEEAKVTASYLETTRPDYGVQIIPPNAGVLAHADEKTI